MLRSPYQTGDWRTTARRRPKSPGPDGRVVSIATACALMSVSRGIGERTIRELGITLFHGAQRGRMVQRIALADLGRLGFAVGPAVVDMAEAQVAATVTAA